jgi:hypothetical protein
MPEDLEVLSNVLVSSLRLKEEIEEIYIYQDFSTEKFSIYYNDEIKLPINLEKTFWKKYKKVKNYFSILSDITVQLTEDKKIIQILFVLKSKKELNA